MSFLLNISTRFSLLHKYFAPDLLIVAIGVIKPSHLSIHPSENGAFNIRIRIFHAHVLNKVWYGYEYHRYNVGLLSKPILGCMKETLLGLWVFVKQFEEIWK